MLLNENAEKALKELLHKAVNGIVSSVDYGKLCISVGVSKMYYDMILDDPASYRDFETGKFIMTEVERDEKIILFDSGEKTGLIKQYTYYYDGSEYVHAYIEFKEGIKDEELDDDLYSLLADFIYLLASRQNMRIMLDYAEANDAATGISNGVHFKKMYEKAIKLYPDVNYAFMFINIRNFKFLNEQGGAKAGDEAIIIYANKIASFLEPDECVCRLGGDNFLFFVKPRNVNRMIQVLSGIELVNMKSAKGKEFTVSAWIGISIDEKDADFSARLEHASTACMMAKTRIKKNVVFYNDELAHMVDQSKRILGMFGPALTKGEFLPFFQAKVDMSTGSLIGFEALCRWKHEGGYIYPDQFIPIIDAQNLIHELDMEILRQSCVAIRQWKDMGLTPPPISVNLSRKNIFVPNIEQKILTIIRYNNIDTSDIEIEITETAKESEYNRLISFINRLKEMGLRISIDDFGTGYSSLSLIHNINADVIKIDKSFVNALFDEGSKSMVLVESIISLAKRLGMELIAEGVESREEGLKLMEMGCINAQGYYYSKPSDFDFTTDIIKDPPFKPIVPGEALP